MIQRSETGEVRNYKVDYSKDLADARRKRKLIVEAREKAERERILEETDPEYRRKMRK